MPSTVISFYLSEEDFSFYIENKDEINELIRSEIKEIMKLVKDKKQEKVGGETFGTDGL